MGSDTSMSGSQCSDSRIAWSYGIPVTHRRTASQFHSVAASKCEFQKNATHPVLEPDAHHARKDCMPQARSFSGTSKGSRRWSCKEEQRTEERCRTAIGQIVMHVLPSRRAALEVGQSESIRRQLTSLSARRPGLPSPGLARTRALALHVAAQVQRRKRITHAKGIVLATGVG